MSAQTTATAPRLAPTTYAQLTHKASCAIARASVAIEAAEHPEPGQRVGAEVAAVRDVAAALVHLGSTLLLGPATGSVGQPARRPVADARIMAALRAVAEPRDWKSRRPVAGPVADLDRAGVLIRTAADLWSTHLAADGRPRSPEAARMRHPATRGAAMRQWRCLVTLTAQVADALTAARLPGCAESDAAAALSDFPRPGEASSRAGSDGDLLHLTVARPALPAGQPPLLELASRVQRLLHLAWRLAGTGDAPAVIHVNLALIAVAIHRAAAAAHDQAAATTPPGSTRRRHLVARDQARRGSSTWQDIADLVRHLRTPHAHTHPIQIERLEIERLLQRAASGGDGGAATSPEWELTRIARTVNEVAGHSAEAIRIDHDRGQVLLLGRGIPTEALTRRPDLLQARLAGQAIVAPTLSMARLQAAYRRIAGDKPGGAAPPVNPSAA